MCLGIDRKKNLGCDHWALLIRSTSLVVQLMKPDALWALLPDGLCQAVTESVLLVANSIDLRFLHSERFSVCTGIFNVFRVRCVWTNNLGPEYNYDICMLSPLSFGFCSKHCCDLLAPHSKLPWRRRRAGKKDGCVTSFETKTVWLLINTKTVTSDIAFTEQTRLQPLLATKTWKYCSSISQANTVQKPLKC